ncbi:hypothetical protein FB451DRAFT_1558619 [Mycena latifolia]|nr:hypothetical protein FB451DRAFT_1558619 [Mycena latifolia]
MHDTKPKKPPACDACKVRRVLCHSQPNGASCPRCAEKDIKCTTTPVPRGRPRKNPVLTSPALPVSKTTQNLVSRPSSSSSSSMALRSHQIPESLNDCPDLSPSLVSHLFQCFDRMVPALNPIIASTSITTTIRTVSFQLYLLPPLSRALALSIIALSSLVSFLEVLLGEGPRPQSFSDQAFFSSRREMLSCGARRSAASRALYMEALKAAWDSGVMLQVSKDSAATCFLLDVLEQLDSCGPSRPWAAAYISHLRALAPVWRISPLDANGWAGHLMAEALRATSSRKPILFTCGDQILLTGPEPPSAETLLGSLESSSENSGTVLSQSMRPYTFHVTCLARQLWETITGDHARLSPLSEGAAIQFLASLSSIHAILTRLLVHADNLLASGSKISGDDRALVRNCGLGIGLGFAVIALPLHREFEHRERTSSINDGGHAQERLRLLRAQAREMAVLGVREFARALRYLPPIHFVQINLTTVRDYAQFALEEAEGSLLVSPEQVRDLETIAGQLVLSGYSLDFFSSPQNASLLDRLEAYIRSVRRVQDSLDPGNMLGDIFLPLDQGWLDPTSEEATLAMGSIPISRRNI